MPMTVSYVGSGTVRRKTERRSLNRQSRKTGTMNTKAEIQTMLAAYTARYPDERAAMEPFVRYVASFDTLALYDRKNFVGHLTAGALIVSRQTGCVLLLKHKQLGKWLQPGGHVEASDASVLDAAFREAREETGIGRDRLELLAPQSARGILVRMGKAVCRELKLYLRGQGIIAAIVGALAALGLWLAGVRSALVLGIERPEGPVTNPSASERLRAGDVVWAVGDPQRMKPFFEAVRQE